MAYSEEKDLIQNMKDLEKLVSDMNNSFSQLEPSIDEILKLKEQFENLKQSTLGIIDEYEQTLTNKTEEMNDLLTSCRSQFKQVTNDVESLVNLQVNFSSIESKINRCLELSNSVNELIQGPFVLMDGANNYVKPSDRLASKYYMNVVSSYSK